MFLGMMIIILFLWCGQDNPNIRGPKNRLLWLLLFQKKLAGGFKYFLFSSLPGEMIQFDEHIFQRGWNHQLEKRTWTWELKIGLWKDHHFPNPLFGLLLLVFRGWNAVSFFRFNWWGNPSPLRKGMRFGICVFLGHPNPQNPGMS